MTVRKVLAMTLVGALALAGCGDDSSSSKKKSEKAAKNDPKTKAVNEAEQAFEKDKNDLNACRNLANAYVARASPTSTGDPKKPPPPVKDREKWLGKASETLESCRGIDKKDVNTTQMLASTYMALGKYKEATPLLRSVAEERKNDSNSYYAWGLAASNSQDVGATIRAWEQFLRFADRKDPRIKQVRESLRLLKAEQAKGGGSGGK